MKICFNCQQPDADLTEYQNALLICPDCCALLEGTTFHHEAAQDAVSAMINRRFTTPHLCEAVDQRADKLVLIIRGKQRGSILAAISETLNVAYEIERRKCQ